MKEYTIKKKTETDNFSNKRFFFNKARIAFTEILKVLNEGTKILLPSYIGINDKEGSGVFDPIRENNIKYDFYSLNEDLSINKEDFNKKIKDPEVKAVLVIHYFGFMQTDIEKVSQICKDNEVLLIEDCAHSLLSEFKDRSLGSYGDFSFFSLHKFLPMEKGGILQINNKEFIPKFEKSINKNEINHDLPLKFIEFDFKKIANKRCKNYLYLLSRIKEINNIKILYPELSEGIVPMNFPIFIKNRDQVYFHMNEKGIELISLYHRIIDPISENYHNSHYISKNITNLPIHQDIRIEDIDNIIKELKKLNL